MELKKKVLMRTGRIDSNQEQVVLIGMRAEHAGSIGVKER